LAESVAGRGSDPSLPCAIGTNAEGSRILDTRPRMAPAPERGDGNARNPEGL
jgi:hypothetical protein